MAPKYLIVVFVMFISCSDKSGRPEVEHLSSNTLNELMEGNRRFLSGRSSHAHTDVVRARQVSKLQKPIAIVVSCSDSRVSPEIIFDQGLGDLFVIRTAGNILSNIELGSIQYAVEHLAVKLIVIMGHEDCGAVKAAAGEEIISGPLSVLVQKIRDEPEIKSISTKKPIALDAMIKANIHYVANQVSSNSAGLGELLKEKKVDVICAEYHLHNGKIYLL